jgi:O-antigen/teichoic acid export membrane protein
MRDGNTDGELGIDAVLSVRASSAMNTDRVRWLLRSAGLRHGLVVGTSMVLAGVFDYGVNVLAGRWLKPAEYGTFISVMAILQVLFLLSITIRMVVAFYTAELSARLDSSDQLEDFLWRVWRGAWKWGLVATAAIALVCPFLASSLQLPNAWPMWAASVMVLFLFLRECAYGALQGTRAFTRLGIVQVVGALMRLLFAAILIWFGGRASGAILAQSLGTCFALGLSLWWLRSYFRRGKKSAHRAVSWHYSATILLGLGVFGLLTNLDALFVKHFFTEQVAGNYGPVVTLSKVSLFLPWAIGMVLLPSVTQRQANGRNPRPLLLAALTAAIVPGLGITAVCFLCPGLLVRIIFTRAYADPGIVLGLASLAASLYAGLFIWLNYSASLERRAFAYVLVGVLLCQLLGMLLFGRQNLVHMTLAMVSAGLLGNLAGFATTWSIVPKTTARVVRAEAVVPEF